MHGLELLATLLAVERAQQAEDLEDSYDAIEPQYGDYDGDVAFNMGKDIYGILDPDDHDESYDEEIIYAFPSLEMFLKRRSNWRPEDRAIQEITQDVNTRVWVDIYRLRVTTPYLYHSDVYRRARATFQRTLAQRERVRTKRFVSERQTEIRRREREEYAADI